MSVNYVPTYALPEAKENWREGVDLVKQFLKPRDVYSPNGALVVTDEYGTPHQEPWMFIDSSCTNTIREFNNYRAKEARPEINPREAAKNYDDHALDAIRYALMHIFKLGCTHSLADVVAINDVLPTRDHFRDELPTGTGGFFNSYDLDNF